MLSFLTPLLSDDNSLTPGNEDEQYNIACHCTTNKGLFVKYLVQHFYDCFGIHM